MLEPDHYEDLQEILSHQASWVVCELGELLAEKLMEGMQSE